MSYQGIQAGKAISCGNKKAHLYKAQASKQMTALIRKGKAGDKILNVYKCPFCKLYHVGHKNKKNGINKGSKGH